MRRTYRWLVSLVGAVMLPGLGIGKADAATYYFFNGLIESQNAECGYDVDLDVTYKINGVTYQQTQTVPDVHSFSSYGFGLSTSEGQTLSDVKITPVTGSCYTFSPPSVIYASPTPSLDGDNVKDFTRNTNGPYQVTVNVRDQNGIGVSGVSLSGFGINVVSYHGNGVYKVTVCCGFSATITPHRACTSFSPSSQGTGTVTSNKTLNFTATYLGPYTISGTVRMSDGSPAAGIDVTVTGESGTVTAADGTYHAVVPCGWSGNIFPVHNAGNGFWTPTPSVHSFVNVRNDISDPQETDFVMYTAPPVVLVATPNGGESYHSANAMNIAWNVDDEFPASVRCDLWWTEVHADGSLFAFDIAENLTVDQYGDGSYSWNIPPEGNTGPQYGQGSFGTQTQTRILVIARDHESQTGTDNSDGFFTIEWISRNPDDDEPDLEEPQPKNPPGPGFGQTTDVQVAEFALQSASPNPFSEQLSIAFALPEGAEVRLSVFDIAGREVKFLEQGWMGAGRHEIVWDGRDDAGNTASSGVYFIALRSATDRRVTRVVKWR